MSIYWPHYPSRLLYVSHAPGDNTLPIAVRLHIYGVVIILNYSQQFTYMLHKLQRPTHQTRITTYANFTTVHVCMSCLNVTSSLKMKRRVTAEITKRLFMSAKRRKTHKSQVLMRPYLIICIAIRASISSKRKLPAFALDSRG